MGCEAVQRASFDEADIRAALVHQYTQGATRSLDRLISVAYGELKRMARGQVRMARDLTLDTTSLVHELYLRVTRSGPLDIASYSHFMAICGRVMRQLISNHVRDAHASKRGGAATRVELMDDSATLLPEADDLILIDQALQTLERIDERLMRVFECRFFSGMSEEETAQALDMSLRTVQRDWLRARAWLAELVNERRVA
jgi:RNA polymerase sigma factor (TIGR02999 family)